MTEKNESSEFIVVRIHNDVRGLQLYSLNLTVEERGLEKLSHLFHVLCHWLALPSLPTAKRAGVNPELSRKDILSYAKGTPN